MSLPWVSKGHHVCPGDTAGWWVTPKTHPEVFADPVWRHYWVSWARSEMSVPATGRYVPTEVVQTFYDFLVLGSELYRGCNQSAS